MCQQKVLWYQGKVKTFFAVEGMEDIIFMFSSDVITALDGSSRDVCLGLGIVRTQIARLIFEYLNRFRLKTHYLDYEGDQCLKILKTVPIPLEVVVRFEAEGSYLLRHRKTKKGQIFPDPIIEFFYKDDFVHDPMLVLNKNFTGFEAINPRTGYFLGSYNELLFEEIFCSEMFQCFTGYDVYQMLVANSRYIATTIKNLFLPSFSLLDIKLEFGWHSELGLILIDWITPDEFRLRRFCDNSRFDKDIYRELGPTQLPILLQQYQEIRNYLFYLT